MWIRAGRSAGPAGARTGLPRRQSTARLDVPYVAQSEALCGGAAAAMVLRYWGERGVNAEDSSPLLNARRDGIETGVLVNALVERGWRALAFTGTTSSVTHHVGRQRPVIALIAIAPGRFHYVVVLQMTDRGVIYHDPAGRPSQTMAIADFDAAWSASSRWTLLVLPREAPRRTEPRRPSRRRHFQRRCRPGLDASGRCRRSAAVRPGRTTVEAARVPVRPTRRLCASWLACACCSDARQTRCPWLARPLRAIPPTVTPGRVLGTAEFLQRNQIAALSAWNRTGEPLNDLVRVDGLARTRHRVVTDRLGLAPGDVLTPSDLGRARRRLGELPAAAPRASTSRLLAAGSSRVDAAVLERPLMPASPLALGDAGSSRAGQSRGHLAGVQSDRQRRTFRHHRALVGGATRRRRRTESSLSSHGSSAASCESKAASRASRSRRRPRWQPA